MSALIILLKLALFAALAGLCLWLLAGAGPQAGESLAAENGSLAARDACWISIF
jgi:hypothetical protein